jgi:tetratricopeptide (TPR) repeat protein
MLVWPFALSLTLAQGSPAPAPTPEDLIKKIDAAPDLKGREKPFEISASLTRLYFSQGRTKDAQVYAQDALAAAEPALKFYVEQKNKLGTTPGAPLADAKCDPEKGQEATLANVLDVARRHAEAKRTAAAVTCARKALHGVPDVLLMDGNARFLARDLGGARASYERVAMTFSDVPEALYARAALTLDEKPDDVRALEGAQRDFEAFLAAAPRARQVRNAAALLARTRAGISAGGLSKLTPVPVPAPPPPAGMPVLDPATIAAFQNAPKTAEGDARFAKLIEDSEESLAKGRYQEALDGFKQVMPFQPENPRLRAGMAWTLVKLGKPMAENVWRVASGTPEALDALGDRLKAKGDGDGAKALWTRLAETVPGYAAKLEGKR